VGPCVRPQLLEEDLSHGQVVAAYTVEAQSAVSGQWSVVPQTHGRTIGFRLDDWGLGNMTGVSALRLNCTASLVPGAVATINTFAAYRGANLPSMVPPQ
jgi:hypothetical protein